MLISSPRLWNRSNRFFETYVNERNELLSKNLTVCPTHKSKDTVIRFSNFGVTAVHGLCVPVTSGVRHFFVPISRIIGLDDHCDAEAPIAPLKLKYGQYLLHCMSFQQQDWHFSVSNVPTHEKSHDNICILGLGSFPWNEEDISDLSLLVIWLWASLFVVLPHQKLYSKVFLNVTSISSVSISKKRLSCANYFCKSLVSP